MKPHRHAGLDLKPWLMRIGVEDITINALAEKIIPLGFQEIGMVVISGVSPSRSKSFRADILSAIDVSGWTEGVLQVRVHESDFDDTSNMYVSLSTTAPSAEDPSQDFVGSEVASASIDSTTDEPGLVTDALASDFGGAVQVSVVGDKGTGSCNAAISADLILKS